MISRRQMLTLMGAGLLQSAWGVVDQHRLLNAFGEPQNWLTYSGNFAGWRYSSLTGVRADNVHRLTLSWVYQLEEPGRFETTPIVVDGVMYVSAPGNEVLALDASAGRVIWRYRRDLPDKLYACCRVNRGVAVLGDKVYVGTLDAHLVALDALSGAVIWEVEAANYTAGYSFTSAPMAIKNKIIVGPAGGEWGIRGFVDAYDANTGVRAWRFHTVPEPGEFGHDTWKGESWRTGGGPVWMSGSYDPELNLLYIGVGNPGPNLYGDDREGDNLFTCCLVALDVDTGERKWHYQFTSHDLHDWDANVIPILLDAPFEGKMRKLLVDANRNGYYYVLDRTDGTFLRARPFVKTTWAIQERPDGPPKALPSATPTPNGAVACPSIYGGTNWMSPSYSPRTNLVYVMTREECDTYYSEKQEFQEGRSFWAGTPKPVEGGWGALRAFEPVSGDLRWEYRFIAPCFAGVLSTAGDVVFAGHMDGNFMAFDARGGKVLWHTQTGGPIIASPMTYQAGRRQHVAIAAGNALFAFALPEQE